MSRGRAVAVLVAGAGLVAVTRRAEVLPATVAVLGAVLVLADTGGRRAPGVAGAAAVLSAAWTAGALAIGHRLGTGLADGLLTLAETLATLVAVAFVVARAAPRPAAVAAALSAVAVSTTVLRSAEAGASATTALGGAVWGLLVLGATAAGLHLRGVAARQVAAVGAARREHRLQLAADLHDYVAHDVSEMLALAQAGRVVSADPRAAELFDAIEQAAQHSMRSLDRAVAALGDAAADLDELLARFDRATAARVEVDTDPALLGGLPPERAALVHRVVTEALTNVRRHAPAADLIRVTAHRDGTVARLSIVDNGGPGGDPGNRFAAQDGAGRDGAGRDGAGRDGAGRGLASLRDRVTAAGGTFTAGPSASAADHAGPAGPAGWRVTATLPL